MKKLVPIAACLALLIVVGCSQQQSTNSSSSATNSGIDGSKYLLAGEPEGALNVIQAREEVEDKADVVIVGRIGGSVNPWVDGRAAFSIVDVSLKSCEECGADDCEKPWDYC